AGGGGPAAVPGRSRGPRDERPGPAVVAGGREGEPGPHHDPAGDAGPGLEDQVPRLVPGRGQFQVVVDVLAVLEPAQGVSDLVLGAGPGAAAAGQPDRRGNRGADGGGGRTGS